MRKKAKFGLALAAFMLMATAAQGNFGVYLGYEQEGKLCFADGVTLHYTDQGSGEPLILLHGYGMNTDITWRLNGDIERLSQRYRVIGLDMRGHGLSAKPYTPGSYGVEMARDIVRLMDGIGIQRAHLAGNSLGAMVAIKTAVLYPDRIASLLACGMGWARYRDDKCDIHEALMHSLSDGDGLAPLIRFLRPKDDPAGWMELTAINAVVMNMNDTQALLAMTRQMPELEVSESDLRHLPVPVLNVVASKDPLLVDVQDMAALVPGHELVVVDGADHFNLTGVSATVDAMLDFLERHPVVEVQPAVT